MCFFELFVFLAIKQTYLNCAEAETIIHFTLRIACAYLHTNTLIYSILLYSILNVFILYFSVYGTCDFQMHLNLNDNFVITILFNKCMIAYV